MFEQSQSIEKLSAALAKAQGEIKTAKEDSQNPHFKSSYADLASVWEACRAALSKAGVSIVQVPVTDAEGTWLVTQLMHAGEFIRGKFKIVPMKNDAHGIGSAITYMRRYSLAAMVGVAPDEDDDGNAATGRDNMGVSTRKQQPTQPPASKLTEEMEAQEKAALDMIQHCRSSGDLTALETWRAGPAIKDWFVALQKADRGRALALKAELDSALAFLQTPQQAAE